MQPLGYLYKKVVSSPSWLQAPHVKDLYSVSGCISVAFAPYLDAWKHNGFWLFDHPDAMVEIAKEQSVDLEEMTLFYYEAHEQEYDEEAHQWVDYAPEPSFPLAVHPPSKKSLAGFDIVSFSMGNAPECSPLSCNLCASTIKTNEHCLLSSWEEAKDVLEQGLLGACEPGPYRVLAVYLVEAL